MTSCRGFCLLGNDLRCIARRWDLHHSTETERLLVSYDFWLGFPLKQYRAHLRACSGIACIPLTHMAVFRVSVPACENAHLLQFFSLWRVFTTPTGRTTSWDWQLHSYGSTLWRLLLVLAVETRGKRIPEDWYSGQHMALAAYCKSLVTRHGVMVALNMRVTEAPWHQRGLHQISTTGVRGGHEGAKHWAGSVAVVLRIEKKLRN